MRRVIRLYEAPVSVGKWELCGALAIVAAFLLVLTIVVSSAFAPHRTKLSIRSDFGIADLGDLRR